jgi:hypothetical protein
MMPWAWTGAPKALSSFNGVLFLEGEIVEQNLGHLHLRIDSIPVLKHVSNQTLSAILVRKQIWN